MPLRAPTPPALVLIRVCAGISKLYFAMLTCFPWVFEMLTFLLMRLFRSALEPDVLNYAFFASRLQSASLQTKLIGHSGIVASGNTFHDALCVFNKKMKTEILSNPSEIVAPKLMKKLADIYFTRVTQTAESTFSLSPRQMALWQSQMEDHTSDWLWVVPISGLGQTMNAYSRIFAEDIYGDHAVPCAGIIGIKHRHNVVRDTLVELCYHSRILACKEVDIGLDEGRGKPLHPADMLLYSWDGGLDRKRGKYMAKCAAIGYGFLPISFSSLRELEADAVTLLKRIRKFSMAQDIGVRAAVHIFNRISFAIAKGIFFAWGIREGCGDPTEADPKVLRDLRH
ncbi:hypothetical protein Tco_0571401 [Tanacetum coccineum]